MNSDKYVGEKEIKCTYTFFWRHRATRLLQILYGESVCQPDQVLPLLLLSQHQQLQHRLLQQGQRCGSDVFLQAITRGTSYSHFFKIKLCHVLPLSHNQCIHIYPTCCGDTEMKSFFCSSSSSSSPWSHSAACSARQGLFTSGLNRYMWDRRHILKNRYSVCVDF